MTSPRIVARGIGARRAAFEQLGSAEATRGGAAAPVKTPAEVEAEAEALVAAAQARARAIEEAAQREGFSQGYREGLEAARAASAPGVELLGAAVRAAQEARARAVAGAEAELLALALALAERILHREVTAGPGEVAALARGLVERARERRGLVLRVHPEDYAGLLQARRTLLEGLPGEPDLRLEADPGVGRGGCLLETPSGILDGRLESQLEEALRALKEGYLAWDRRRTSNGIAGA
jgi:flagellar assembly protein FliH